jgi:glycogen synthase
VSHLRVVSFDGPGDVVGTFRRWQAGEQDPRVTHLTFSAQIFDACSALKAELWMQSENLRLDRAEHGGFLIENRGNASLARRGVAYHGSELIYSARMLAEVKRYRPHAVLISSFRPHPFLMRALRRTGVHLIYVLHNVLWPKHGSPTRVQRVLNRLNAPALREASAILCVSEDVKRQVREIAGPRCAPFVDFLPSFEPRYFRDIAAPVPEARPFRVLFAGRIEAAKGVFHLLEIARALRDAGVADIEFEICGDGSAMEQLRARTRAWNLEDKVHIRGWCERPQMMEAFGRSHLVLVPTTTEFSEGFNMVVIEALLAGRPVISSSVCPALDYVAGGVKAVPPDAVRAYADAIAELARDRAAYRRLQQGAVAAGARFLDDRMSYGDAALHALHAIAEGRPVEPREISPTQRAG